MLRLRISSLHICSTYALAPDDAQHTHKGRSIRVRNSIFLIIFEVPQTAKNFKKLLLTLTNGLKSSTKKFIFPQTQKKSSLKLD